MQFAIFLLLPFTNSCFLILRFEYSKLGISGWLVKQLIQVWFVWKSRSKLWQVCSICHIWSILEIYTYCPFTSMIHYLHFSVILPSLLHYCTPNSLSCFFITLIEIDACASGLHFCFAKLISFSSFIPVASLLQSINILRRGNFLIEFEATSTHTTQKKKKTKQKGEGERRILKREWPLLVWLSL